MSADLKKLAKILDNAATAGKPVRQLSGEHKFSVAEAYEIQRLIIERRTDRGERLTGVKLGFTSRAKMRQMGVSSIVYGRLTSGGAIEDGGQLDLSGRIHPRTEPEIAFLLKRPLNGPLTLPAAHGIVEAVAPALEVIDSRYKDFKFSLADVIADNTSSSGYVVGRWNSPRTDVSNRGMLLEFNGRPVAIGSSAAILGNPWRALVTVARLLSDQEQSLPAGSIVLVGSPVEAEALRPGLHVRAEVEKLGRVEFTTAAEART